MARPKKVHVVLSRQGNQWLATATEDASLSIGGHNTRSARLRVANMIKERYGDNTEIDFKFNLPEEQQTSLERYLSKERLLQSMVEELPAERISIAEELLAIHLTQQEVGELMGLSQGHLAVILKREATAGVPIRPTTRRTTPTR
jgi:hypothetical protein